MRTSPAVDGQVVIDAPDNVSGGEVFPHERVVRDKTAGATIS